MKCLWIAAEWQKMSYSLKDPMKIAYLIGALSGGRMKSTATIGAAHFQENDCFPERQMFELWDVIVSPNDIVI